MIPVISVAFIDENGVKHVSFDLLRREDNKCRSVASVSFRDGRPFINFTIKELETRKVAIVRLARKYESRASCQTFHKTLLPS